MTLTQIIQRAGTTAEWTAANPVLALGELGFELLTIGTAVKQKVGDGATPWASLPYSGGGGSSGTVKVEDIDGSTVIGRALLKAIDAFSARAAIGAGTPAPAGTTTVPGLVQLATTAQTVTGTATGTAATPAGVAAALAAGRSDASVTEAMIAPAAVTLPKLAATGNRTAQTYLRGDGVFAELPAASTGAQPAGTPLRRMTASGPLILADAGGFVEAEHPTVPIVVTLPLTGTVPFSSTEPTVISVARMGAADVTIAPYLTSSPFQKVLADGGLKVPRQYLEVSVRTRPVPVSPRPTTDLVALLTGESLGAHGTAVAAWPETSGSSLALPPATQTVVASQPTVSGAFSNNRKGLYLNGTGAHLKLLGSWLNLTRNRTQLQVFITFLSGPVLTGDRTLLQFSTGASATTARLNMQQREAVNGNMTMGGRRLDSETTGIYVAAGPLVYPDLCCLSGRFLWGTSDLYTAKNGAAVANSTAFQTDGATSDTASLAATVGARADGTSQFAACTIGEIAIYANDSAQVRADYEAFAESYFGTQWHVLGGAA